MIVHFAVFIIGIAGKPATIFNSTDLEIPELLSLTTVIDADGINENGGKLNEIGDDLKDHEMNNEKPVKTRLKNRVNTVRKMDEQVSNDMNSLLDFKTNPEDKNNRPFVVNAWREDDLDSGETISKGQILFEFKSRNGQIIESTPKKFKGLSFKDVNAQIEEFLNKNYHLGMIKTEYDCKLNAKINFEPTSDHPDISKLNVNQDKIFPVKDLNEANEKYSEFQESWQQYFHKIHKEYQLSGNIKFNRLCKSGNAADELSELAFPSRDHHHQKSDIMKATFKRLCKGKFSTIIYFELK